MNFCRSYIIISENVQGDDDPRRYIATVYGLKMISTPHIYIYIVLYKHVDLCKMKGQEPE